MTLLKNAKSLMMLIILALAMVGLGYYKFFYEPDKLKTTVATQGAAIKTVENANRAIREGVTVQEESKVLKELVVQEGAKIKEQLAKQGFDDSVKTETHIQAIKSEYGNQIDQSKEPLKTAALVKAREKAISKTRIDSLWTSYCRNEPNDPDCGSYK